jgi:hypothetical protein
MIDLIINESLVLLEVFLYMDLETDDIVEDLFNFGVEFFAERVRTDRQLFVSNLKRWVSRDIASGNGKISGIERTYSRLVFISRCSIICTLSVNPERSLESSFSIRSICASRVIL